MNNTHRPHDVKTSDGIKRTAAELAAWRPQVVAEYLALHTGDKATIRHLILHRAAVSSFVSDAMFRQLFVELGFTKNETCGGSEACNDRIAALLGEDPRTVKRIHTQMEKIGLADKPQRRRNRSSVRGFSPLHLTMILNPVLCSEVTNLSLLISERAKVSLLEPRKDIPVPCEPLARDKIAPLTLLDEDEEDNRDACASENGSNFEVLKSEKPHALISESQFEEWNRIGNAWGGGTGKQAARRDTDPILASLVDAFSGDTTDTVRQALADVLGNLAAMLLGPQTGVGFPAARKYAANHMRTAVAEARKSLAEQEAAVRIAAELAEIKIAKERAIADQGVAAHASAVATGAKIREARAAAPKEDWRNRKAKSRAMTNKVLAGFMADGETPAPERFDDALPKIVEVHGVWITGRDANRIIDAIDGCTKRIVEDALFEAGGAAPTDLGAPSKRNELLGVSEATGKPTAIGIIEWATKRAKRLMLFAKFGKPQDLCGGPVAHGHSIRSFNGLHKISMESEYLCISQEFMDRMKEKYPNAWVEHVSFRDESGNNSSAAAGDKAIYYIFSDFVKKMSIDAYGVSLQKDAESAMERGISALHDAMTRGLRLKAEESERLKAEFPDSFLLRKTLPGRAALAAS